VYRWFHAESYIRCAACKREVKSCQYAAHLKRTCCASREVKNELLRKLDFAFTHKLPKHITEYSQADRRSVQKVYDSFKHTHPGLYKDVTTKPDINPLGIRKHDTLLRKRPR
jgi:hypothetical protein